MTKAFQASQNEYSKIQGSIEKYNLEATQMILASTEKLDRAKQNYEAKIEQCGGERDAVLGNIVNGLVEVFGFHQNVTNGIEELKMLVA